jgi:PleD family two-component response regulator
MEADAALRFADQIVSRIRSLSIHHPRSVTGKFLTVSAGVVTVRPPREASHATILAATQVAVGEAKSGGGNRAIRGDV